MNHGNWKKVPLPGGDSLYRIEVPGGWLYRSLSIVQGNYHVSIAFVPMTEEEKRNDNTNY